MPGNRRGGVPGNRWGWGGVGCGTGNRRGGGPGNRQGRGGGTWKQAGVGGTGNRRGRGGVWGAGNRQESVCLHHSTYAHVYPCVFRYSCVSTRGGQKAALGVCAQDILPHTLLLFLRQCLSVARNLSSRLGWLDRASLQDLPVSTSPALGSWACAVMPSFCCCC